MNTAITLALTFIQAMLPKLLGDSNAIGQVINMLIQIIPILVQEYKDVLPAVQNIIAALSSDPATTAEQRKKLEELDAMVDAAFDQAILDYDKNHPET